MSVRLGVIHAHKSLDECTDARVTQRGRKNKGGGTWRRVGGEQCQKAPGQRTTEAVEEARMLAAEPVSAIL